MNVQSIIIILLVAVAVVVSIKVYRKKGTSCSCGGDCKACGFNCKQDENNE